MGRWVCPGLLRKEAQSSFYFWNFLNFAKPLMNFLQSNSIKCDAWCCVDREIYVSSIYPQRKNVVIMIDHGNSLSVNQMRTAKAIAKFVLLSLGEEDRVRTGSNHLAGFDPFLVSVGNAFVGWAS